MKPMRRALSLLLLLPFVLLSAGCKQEEGNAPLKVRKEAYTKVVSLSPGTSEIIASPFGMQLAGRSQADNYPNGVLDRVPVMASIKPDYESLSKLAPDLIVYDGSLYNAQDQEKLKALGFRTFKLDANTLEDFRNQLFALASLVGHETSCSDYLDRITIEVNNAKAKPPTPKPTVAVMMPGTTGSNMISGTDSFLSDVVRQCGGEPVGPKGTEFVPVNPEALISLNPDEIIVNGSTLEHSGYDAFMKDPRFQVLKAVKGGHVTVIDSDVLLRRGSRVDNLVKGVFRAITGK
jgi:iron complex transport system substrate-binding protein